MHFMMKSHLEPYSFSALHYMVMQGRKIGGITMEPDPDRVGYFEYKFSSDYWRTQAEFILLVNSFNQDEIFGMLQRYQIDLPVQWFAHRTVQTVLLIYIQSYSFNNCCFFLFSESATILTRCYRRRRSAGRTRIKHERLSSLNRPSLSWRELSIQPLTFRVETAVWTIVQSPTGLYLLHCSNMPTIYVRVPH